MLSLTSLETSWAALESNSLFSWNFGSTKIVGQKQFWVQKNFESKTNFGSKNIVGLKKFESAKYFESKTFGPPFLRRRVKYGGLVWGFHSFALE